MNQQPRPEGQRDPIEKVARLLETATAPTNSMVLLDGPPLSGVTWSMYEAVQRCLPTARLAPLTALELAELSAWPDFVTQFSGGEQFVLWLDGLSPADLVLLGSGVLDKVLPYALVLASVDTAWRERLIKDGSAVTAPARTVLLEYAERVSVPFGMTQRDRAVIRDMGYPVSKGIAESLVGGENLIKRYHRGARSNREGHLLVQAAVDTRRCGIHRPLGEDELYSLWCARGDYEYEQCRPLFQRALDWASAVPQDASTGLVFLAADARSPDWRALGYVAGADDGDHGHKPRPLQNREWSAVLELLPEAGDQFAIGIAAHLHGRRDIAEVALTEAAEAASWGHPAGVTAVAALRGLKSEGPA
ncbi:hypothetical protein ACFQ8O_02315 [Streptomyces coelicoflavus]|uniref:hypothetical protein n=1 Tax=Streptomyces coelicoflavus TaxID=285562 RepID=UPI0036BBF9CE